MIKAVFNFRSLLPERIICFHLILTLTFLIFCFCTPVSGVAQQTSAKQPQITRELLPNAPIECELPSSETHIYKITLAAGTYLRILITPQNINLESKLFAPNSSNAIGVYYSHSEKGLRFVSLIAEASGDYKLEIRLDETVVRAGRYDVKIEELRPATEQDKIRIAAERVEGEGRILLDKVSTAERFRQGIAKFEEALALWRQLGDRKGELRMLTYIDIQYRDLGEPQTALEYRKQAIQIARALGDRYQEANLTVGFGVLDRSLGENQKALDSFNQARQLFKSLSAKYGEAIAMNHIGLTLAALGEWQNALPYFDEALSIYSAVGARSGEAHILNSIGSINRRLGNIQKGIELHNRALAIAQTNKFVDAEASTLGHLGNAYLELGDKQKALEFYEQGLKRCQISGDRRCEGDNLKLIGDVEFLLGDHQKALDALNQALQLFRAIWERDREAKALHSLARVNYALGNFDEAKKQIEGALDIQESLRANVINQQLRETFFTSAQSSFALYIDLLQQLHKKNPTAGFDAAALQASERARARSLLDLLSESRADIRQGAPPNLLEVERSLQQQINAKAAARTRLLSDKRTEAQAASFDKEIAELSTRYHEVEVQIRQSSPRYASLTQPQPLSATEIQQQLDDNTVLLEFTLGDKQSWLWAVTPSSLNSYLLPSSKEIEPLARKIYELLTARQLKKGETEVQYQSRITQAEAQWQSESALLSHLLFGQLATKLQQEWKGKRLVIVASGALEYIPFAALPVPVAGGQWAVVSEAVVSEAGVGGQGSEVSKAGVGGQGAGVSKEDSRSHKVTRQDISKDRPPTTDHRPPTTDHRPLTTDHRPLTAGYRPLIAEHEIVNIPSASALAALRKETVGRKSAEKLVAVIADPVFELNDPRVLNALKNPPNHQLLSSVRSGNEGLSNVESPTSSDTALLHSLRSFDLRNQRGGFSRLPFSRDEADAIIALAKQTSFLKATDFQATRAIATNGQLARFRIVHFATHGLLNSERPELSGLVLSLVDEHGRPQDGFLRLHEIYNLNLRADLIVLSACQTALGKQIRGEGLVGLTRGFMYAGAERVVASLWQVDDLATAELMKRFYRAMLKEGKQASEALRLAQLEMLKQKRWSAPYFWAAFTIQGEWK